MREKATWTSWVAVTLVGLGMVAGVFVLRPDLKERAQGFLGIHFPAEEVQPEEVQDETQSAQKSKKKATKKKKRIRKPGQTQVSEVHADDDWEDIEFGNIFEEPDPIVATKPEPEFIPPPEMWKPGGSYSPKSSWTQRGFQPGAPTEISMTGPDQVPLTDYQVRQTLNEKLLMPCYREVAQKVPQMEGRVHVKGSIDHDGRILHIAITRSELRSKMVEDCMVQKVKNTRFPRSQGKAITTFTMDFRFR